MSDKTIIIVRIIDQEAKIDFSSPKEKWDFVQEHFPDMADFILMFRDAFGGENKKIGFPHLMVDTAYLKELDNTRFVDKNGAEVIL